MSLLPPSTLLEGLPWVPANRLSALRRQGLATLEDLLRHFPRRYEDRRKFDRFPDAPSEAPVCLFGLVKKTSYKRLGPRRIFEAVLEDDNGGILSNPLTLRWYNMPWVQKMILGGQLLVVFGKPRERSKRLVMEHPEFEVIEHEGGVSLHFDRITPVHPAGDGLPAHLLRELIHRVIEETDLEAIPRLWPQGRGVGAILPDVWRAVHFPLDVEECEQARRQLVRDVFFGIQLILVSRHAALKKNGGIARPGTGEVWRRVEASLPFELTASQQAVMAGISADMAAPHRMNRLLQGDVGSGKTLVALRAMIQAHESGWEAALMAPTQILAEQHYWNFRRILDPLGLPVVLRTSSRREDSMQPLDLFQPQPTGPALVVGTHALLFEGADFERLGLVVIDEQHKFGVLQRTRLIERADAPDVLVMTATPIPRTITQTLYGDLDVSILRHRPLGRGRIITAVRDAGRLPAIVEFLRGEISAGRQAYIVYPLIEESEKLDVKAATAEFEKWKALLAPATVGIVHGRIDPEAKNEVMREFREGRLSVLVSTTVIEVGVDVPNATVMIIEEAGRFGLSQMHQLRGRIGRGPHKSWCILLHDGATGPALEKLQVLEATSDGFEIAEADLRLRGPGDILGTAQTGLPSLGLGDLLRDADIMSEARAVALEVLAEDPALELPAHRVLKEYVSRNAERRELSTG
ncbi:MAG: ATP-dependent DNA helicase RecG [bacterium]